MLAANNAFSLQLVNTQKLLVTAGPDTVFTVTFVYGSAHDPDRFGALTDVTNGNQIQVAAGDSAEQWAITRNAGQQSPSRTLQPPSGAPVVGTSEQSIVAIQFSKVLTTFQAGPTAMLIWYAGVPGYKDGTFAAILDKIAHVQIQSLTVSPNPTYFSGG